jgi:hypothetical protein
VVEDAEEEEEEEEEAAVVGGGPIRPRSDIRDSYDSDNLPPLNVDQLRPRG